VEFPLETVKFQEDILHKRFEIACKMYNSLVTITQKRYKEMTKTKEYRNACELKDKKTLNRLRKECNINEYGFHKDVVKLQHTFKKNIDSNTSQKIATNLWKAYDKLIFGNGKTIHYKKFGELNSLEGKSSETGIRIINEQLVWNKLNVPIKIDKNNSYEVESFRHFICYSRVIRKYVRNCYKYYVQIVFKGTPPPKRCKDTGMFKRIIGTGKVGLDIGTQTLAVTSEQSVKMIVLADQVQSIENEKRRILRKMDRSKRVTNPLNFNENGTFKKGRISWNYSNKYQKLRLELKELYRKQKDMRKYQHECLANQIISEGNEVYVEKMSFSGLQKKAKLTPENKNKRKKRFGKSIANRAPAMFLQILNRKLGYFGKKLIKINTVKARASQFNHIEQTYKKKKLSQRWNIFNGYKVQRDLYSSFLIMNINDDLETFNVNDLNDNFEQFLQLHDLEVNRLRHFKNISSIAI
jgi:hypothetical protein